MKHFTSLLSIFICLASKAQDTTTDNTQLTCGYSEESLSQENRALIAHSSTRPFRKLNTETPLQVNVGVLLSYSFYEAYDGDLTEIRAVVLDRVIQASKAFEKGTNITIVVPKIIIPKSPSEDIFDGETSGYRYLSILSNTFKDFESLKLFKFFLSFVFT